MTHVTPLWYKNRMLKLDKKVSKKELTLEEWEDEIRESNHELQAWLDEFKRGCG